MPTVASKPSCATAYGWYKTSRRRTEHRGGIVSPASFNDAKNVVHIDRVYVPSLQPDIVVREATLRYADGRVETIMRDGVWVVK
jgi:hypothetical protein